MQVKRVFKDFKIKNLVEYHDLNLRSDTYLWQDVFENFRQMFLKLFELDPARLHSAAGLAWEAAFKK